MDSNHDSKRCNNSRVLAVESFPFGGLSIYCDGIEIQRLANGTFLLYKVPAGKHMISAGRTELGQLVDLEPAKEYFFKLDHKNVFVSNWSGRQPMVLTIVPADTARSEMDGLKKVGDE